VGAGRKKKLILNDHQINLNKISTRTNTILPMRLASMSRIAATHQNYKTTLPLQNLKGVAQRNYSFAVISSLLADS
jgi:hypothetical protein